MKLYTSIGPNPRVVKMFMAEKGLDLERVEIDLMGAENRRRAANELGVEDPEAELGGQRGQQAERCAQDPARHPLRALRHLRLHPLGGRAADPRDRERDGRREIRFDSLSVRATNRASPTPVAILTVRSISAYRRSRRSRASALPASVRSSRMRDRAPG